MSLRSKILLILFAVVSLYAILDYGIQRFVVFPSFIRLERDEAKQDMERCVEAVRRELHHLSTLTNDWAAWDDTYQFVQDGNSEYIESNLVVSSFTGSGLNLIYLCNTKGKVVWGKILDLAKEETIQVQEFPAEFLPETHFLLRHETIDSSLAGIYMTERGPMLVASRPIVTSDSKGPIRGSLILGRFLSDDIIETLVEQTRVNFRVWPITQGSIPPHESKVLKYTAADELFVSEVDNDLLHVYKTFPDIEGTPALLVRADVPRDISAKGAKAIWVAMVSILAAGVSVLLGLAVLLKQTILDPISKLTAHTDYISKTEDLSVRINMPQRDEIGKLSKAFYHMVGQLYEQTTELTRTNELLKSEIIERQRAEKKAEAAKKKKKAKPKPKAISKPKPKAKAKAKAKAKK